MSAPYSFVLAGGTEASKLKDLNKGHSHSLTSNRSMHRWLHNEQIQVGKAIFIFQILAADNKKKELCLF